MVRFSQCSIPFSINTPWSWTCPPPPPGVLHWAETKTVLMFQLMTWTKWNKQKKRSIHYSNPNDRWFQLGMQDFKGDFIIALCVWQICVLPQEELMSDSIRGHETRGEKDTLGNVLLIWPEQQFEINLVGKYSETVDEETAHFVRSLCLTCRSNFIFLLLFKGRNVVLFTLFRMLNCQCWETMNLLQSSRFQTYICQSIFLCEW